MKPKSNSRKPVVSPRSELAPSSSPHVIRVKTITLIPLEMFKLTVDILLATTLRNFPFGISEIAKYKVCVSDRTKFTLESLNFNRIHKLSCEKVLPCEVYYDMA